MSRLSPTLLAILMTLASAGGALAQLPAQRSATTGAVAAPSARTAGARASQSRSRAKRPALLILLENGGVSANLPQPVGDPKRQLFPMASCGSLHFALRPGESPAQLVGRLSKVLVDHRRCLSPRAWRVTKVNAETFMKRHSDTLLEEVAKAISLAQNTRGLYDRVIVLEDAAMTPARALTELGRLARTHVVDVHVLAHGGDEAFYGPKLGGRRGYATFNEASFFQGLRGIGQLELGAVYQMNCVSGTLMDDWRRAGAKVVNGTRRELNNYMPQSYFHFMRHWLAGAQYGYAIGEAFKEAALYTRPVYDALGLAGYVDASLHVVQGDRGRRARATRNGAYEVSETAKQTALELAQDLHRQGKTLAQLVAALRAAGHNLTATAKAVIAATRCSTAQLAKALLQSGASPTEVVAALKAKLGHDRTAMARALHSAGCTAGQVAIALRDALGASHQQIIDTLKTLRHSTRSIARVLKRELARDHRGATRLLVRAGCKLTDIARALEQEYRCSLVQIAQDLRAAGKPFRLVARAMWDAGHKSLGRLNSMGNALASAYSQGIAHTMQQLATMGIKV